MVRLYLVRHGRAAASFAEARDPVLDPAGRAQAEALGRVGLGRHVGVAEARHVGDDHPEALGERQDVQEPVGPGARGPVKQDERRPRAPAPPHHASVTAWGVLPPRQALDALDYRCRAVARQVSGDREARRR